MLQLIRNRFLRNFNIVSRYSTNARLELREYQNDAIDSCLKAIKNGKKRIGVSLATGGGKTVIFSELINKYRQLYGNNRSHFRTLILVHRRELAEQAVRTTSKLNGGMNIQMEMGNQKCNVKESDIIVASIQSLTRRLEIYDKDDIDMIIIDEAHHAAADSYQKVLEHFGCSNADSRVPVVGFSATFERYDKKSLNKSFDELVFHRGILEMIDDKWLCESKFTTVKLDIDLTKVATSSATQDFQTGALSKIMNTDIVNDIVLQTYVQKKKENNLKSTLLFGVDIEHIENLEKYLNAHNIKAKAVSSKSKPLERTDAVEKFKNGEIEVLINCGIFTEGTDIPNIDCILLCRPTKSRTLLVQMIGRGLRLHHSKEYCHIIDFVGSTDAGVISVPTLIGVEDIDYNFDDVTLDELRKIKLVEDERNRQVQMKLESEQRIRTEQLSMAESNLNKLEKSFKNFAQNDALDLSLISYSNFKSFHQALAKGDLPDENTLNYIRQEIDFLMNSPYCWVKFTKDAWAFELNNNNHIRLYRNEKKKGVMVYELKLYREIPKYCRDDSNTNIRFVPTVLCRDSDLSKIRQVIQSIIKKYLEIGEQSSERRMTKFASWRSHEATPKQKQLIRNLLLKYLPKSKDGDTVDYKSLINQYLDSLTKGNASKLLFATRLAPVYPIQTLLQNINRTTNNKV
ncbi:putative ATP-dependent helicase IRC3 [Nakaseomyces bracarensis]|uniref:ATP-dependent helicase IRC3 n=1 Tax=Nakaseomyces bracarensis TaxID=273131 RepID=A0ABR4NVJ4_9SACH